MSMNRCLVYAGATITMVMMHTIATFLGKVSLMRGGVFPLFFNESVIKWSAVAIFTFFGIFLIIEGCRMKKKKDQYEDLQEVKDELIEQGHINAE